MNTSTSTPLDSGMLLRLQDPVMLARHNQLGANLLAMEDLYETSQDRFHLMSIILLC